MRIMPVVALALLSILPLTGSRAGAQVPARFGADSHIAQDVFSRSVELGACDSMTIPFQHPQRPTVYLEAGGVVLPMLFDSGTFVSIFINDGLYESPVFTSPARPELVASVDGKAASLNQTFLSDYGSLELGKMGGVRIRNIPFRIHRSHSSSSRDFAGAISPLMFQQHVIYVDNNAQEITLVPRSEWYPEQKAAVLPLITLPRGSFLPLVIGNKHYWFHLDTGFSGSLGILPAVAQLQSSGITAEQGPVQVFQGWDSSVACDALQISSLKLPDYGGYDWSSSTSLTFTDTDACLYDRDYSDCFGIEIAGIAGAGFLAQFNYALDYTGARIYLWTP